MALAVAEAQRVLKPGGLLLDIHPSDQPPRLDVSVDGLRRVLGTLERGAFAADFAATTEALAAARGRGFEQRRAAAFDYEYYFDTLDELTDYLEENEELELASDTLLERALEALAEPGAQLVLAQPTLVTALQKTGDP